MQAAMRMRPMTIGPTTVRQCGWRLFSTFSPLVSTFSGNPMTAP